MDIIDSRLCNDCGISQLFKTQRFSKGFCNDCKNKKRKKCGVCGIMAVYRKVAIRGGLCKSCRSIKRENRASKLKTNGVNSRKYMYDTYINSTAWRYFARMLKKDRGSKCEICGGKLRLTVHHKHYRTLFKEKLSDLKVLCWECHKKEHPNKRS